MRLLLRTILFVFVSVGLSLTGQAVAQEKPKSILELFFPGAEEPKKAKPAARSAKPKAQKKKTKKRISAKSVSAGAASVPNAFSEAQNAPEIANFEKLPTAKKILVVGDFLASGTAAGLNATFEQSPGVVVIDAANGSSGLVRDDFYNWPNEIATLITQQQPSIVVVMIGANDRQELSVAGKREDVRSPAWLADYRKRVQALASAVTSRNIPLVWIGQVPFRSNAMTADMLAINDIFRETADNAPVGSAYVDVWEGFVDETGKFVERGPDLNGQNVALRSGQVNVTKAGYRKIAFYAESPLNRFLGDTSSLQIGALGNGGLPTFGPVAPSVNPNLERMQPIDLLDSTAKAGNELMGATVSAPQPVSQPLAATIPAGRIDDPKITP